MLYLLIGIEMVKIINQHSEDEKDLDIEKGMWSLSFGATRTVITCKKNPKKLF